MVKIMSAKEQRGASMSPFGYIIKIRLLLSITYRAEVFAAIASRLVLILASAFLWKAAYSGVDQVAGVDQLRMLRYTVMSGVLGSLFVFSIEGEVRQKIRMGNIAVDFIKPVNIFKLYFMQDIGNLLSAVFQRAVPVLIFSALFITAPLPSSALNLVLFLISAAVSYIILWHISALTGLLYFKVFNLGPLSNIKDYVISILSGSLIPIWFFPEPLQQILRFFPFIYIYQLPLGIFIGRSSLSDAVFGMAIQAIWAILFALLFRYCSRRVEKSVLIQGG